MSVKLVPSLVNVCVLVEPVVRVRVIWNWVEEGASVVQDRSAFPA